MRAKKIAIASRQSLLALAQTEWVKNELKRRNPGLEVEIVGITTKADKLLDVTLNKIGGKGLFVKELEEALLAGRADIAVHSMKDVPMELPASLSLPVICKREDPRDAFVSNKYESLENLPAGAKVGTASIRRQIQIKLQCPQVEVEVLRGNIHTRLKRLDAGDFDAIILAAAGLKRMHLEERIRHILSLYDSIPAAGQGALGIECREHDSAILELIKPLNDPISWQEVSAERAVCRRIGGGCSIPIAAFAKCEQQNLTVDGFIANPQGNKVLRAQAKGLAIDAERLGLKVANALIDQGALEIVAEFH